MVKGGTVTLSPQALACAQEGELSPQALACAGRELSPQALACAQKGEL